MKAKLITFVRGLSNGTPPRFQSYLKSLTLLLVLALSMNVWGLESVAPANGKTVAIVAVTGTSPNQKYYALPQIPSSASASTFDAIEISVNGSGYAVKKDGGSEVPTWTLVKNASNANQYYISYTSGTNTYYLYKNGTSSSSNYNIKVVSTGQHYWTFTASGSGYSIKSERGSAAQYLQLNNTKFRVNSSQALYILELAPTYTITAESSNTEWGTVNLLGSVITASPKSGYTYANPAYSVTSGKAEVSRNGNEFTVTPTSDCTIQINFAVKTAATITLMEAGMNVPGPNDKYSGDTYTLPSSISPTCGTKTFVGWSTEELPSEGTRPTSNYYEKGAQVTLEANNTFYAVFADVSGDPDNFVKGSQSSLTDGQIVVIHDNAGRALTTDGYTGSKIPGTNITPSSNKIPTTSITDGMKWTVGVVNGKYTFRQGSNYLMAGSMYLEFGTTQTQWELEEVSGGYNFKNSGSYPYIGYSSYGYAYDIFGTNTYAAILNVFVPNVSYANYVTSCATYNVTWKVNNAPVSGGSTTAPGGGKVSALPTAPEPTGGCVGSTFMGWTDHEVLDGEAPTPLFKTVADAPAVTGDVTYHAVFADENE